MRVRACVQLTYLVLLGVRVGLLAGASANSAKGGELPRHDRPRDVHLEHIVDL